MPKQAYPYVKKKWIEIVTYGDGGIHYVSFVTLQNWRYGSTTYGLDCIGGNYYYLMPMSVCSKRTLSFEDAESRLNQAIDRYFKEKLSNTVVSRVKKYL